MRLKKIGARGGGRSLTLKIFGGKEGVGESKPIFWGIELKFEVNLRGSKEMEAYFSKNFRLRRLIYNNKYLLFQKFRLRRA